MKRFLILLLCSAVLGTLFLACRRNMDPARESETFWQPQNLPSIPPDATRNEAEAETRFPSQTKTQSLLIAESIAKAKSSLFEAGKQEIYPLQNSAEALTFHGDLDKALTFQIQITENGSVKIVLLDGAHLETTGQSQLAQTASTEFVMKSGKTYTVLLEGGQNTGVYTFSLSD